MQRNLNFIFQLALVLVFHNLPTLVFSLDLSDAQTVDEQAGQAGIGGGRQVSSESTQEASGEAFSPSPSAASPSPTAPSPQAPATTPSSSSQQQAGPANLKAEAKKQSEAQKTEHQQRQEAAQANGEPSPPPKQRESFAQAKEVKEATKTAEGLQKATQNALEGNPLDASSRSAVEEAKDKNMEVRKKLKKAIASGKYDAKTMIPTLKKLGQKTMGKGQAIPQMPNMGGGQQQQQQKKQQDSGEGGGSSRPAFQTQNVDMPEVANAPAIDTPNFTNNDGIDLLQEPTITKSDKTTRIPTPDFGSLTPSELPSITNGPGFGVLSSPLQDKKSDVFDKDINLSTDRPNPEKEQSLLSHDEGAEASAVNQTITGSTRPPTPGNFAQSSGPSNEEVATAALLELLSDDPAEAESQLGNEAPSLNTISQKFLGAGSEGNDSSFEGGGPRYTGPSYGAGTMGMSNRVSISAGGSSIMRGTSPSLQNKRLLTSRGNKKSQSLSGINGTLDALDRKLASVSEQKQNPSSPWRLPLILLVFSGLGYLAYRKKDTLKKVPLKVKRKK